MNRAHTQRCFVNSKRAIGPHLGMSQQRWKWTRLLKLYRKWMGKWNVVYTHNRILVTLKSTNVLTNATWVNLENMMLSDNKPITKGQILCDSSCTRYWQLIETDSRRCVARNWGEEEMGVRGRSWRGVVATAAQHCECASCHWLYI